MRYAHSSRDLFILVQGVPSKTHIGVELMNLKSVVLLPCTQLSPDSYPYNSSEALLIGFEKIVKAFDLLRIAFVLACFELPFAVDLRVDLLRRGCVSSVPILPAMNPEVSSSPCEGSPRLLSAVNPEESSSLSKMNTPLWQPHAHSEQSPCSVPTTLFAEWYSSRSGQTRNAFSFNLSGQFST
mmetsp:Transcript_30996/g.118897  ORF Transcript_30996/g.118897 Transcript_30996/m.118897 type:complete len:183 (-) Transcript_30996:380-928(-)